MTVSDPDERVECESCGYPAPEQEVHSTSGFVRSDAPIPTAAQLESLGWLYSGTGWLCPEHAPAQ